MRRTQCGLRYVVSLVGLSIAFSLSSCSSGGIASPNAGGPPLLSVPPPSQQVLPAKSSSTTPLDGPITGVVSYGFLMQTRSPHGVVPIIIEKGATIDYNGHQISVGTDATVSGTWNADGKFAATNIVLSGPGSSATKHVLTYGYLGGYFGTHKITWSQAAPYLTWASTIGSDSTAIHAVGIKTIFYSDPNRVQSNDPLFASPESAFSHDCAGHRVTHQYKDITQYVMNPGSSALRTSFASLVVTPTIASGTYDAIYEDNAGPLSEYNLNSFSSTPCNYSDGSWVGADSGLENSLALPVIFNGLSGLNPYGGFGISLSTGLFADSNTMGGNYEHCYTQDSSSSPKYYGALWEAVENTEIYVAQQGRKFICNPTDDYAPAGSSRQISDRLYSYASFLLTYDLKTSIMWARYPAAASGFTVNPEEQLVVENPVNSTPTNISGLQVSSGVYARQYNDCYIAGASVGSCAVVVNSDNASHSFPYSKYHHTLVLSGSSILDGGTISTNGAAPKTLAPMTGAIAFL